jgi:hypothetical protein
MTNTRVVLVAMLPGVIQERDDTRLAEITPE